ncbi:hypothetical protein RFEPED_1226 [Rickettsia felis str. Pedreira]|uniref:Uncharacterized protein n=1 Tax=Rickettsia felis str. Pedreira TaxID=1359196 RepID=A0A0F3MSR8_RICFI|nr:hypothetical protein RFEPED_1226 [Rickettsia felis str. Pedreira]
MGPVSFINSSSTRFTFSYEPEKEPLKPSLANKIVPLTYFFYR